MNANKAAPTPVSDQGVVDPDVGIERGWVGLLAHGGDVRRAAEDFCEVDHIGCDFFAAK